MNYPYTVQSVAEIHPVLAENMNIVDAQAFQGVHASNAVGTPVDPLAAKRAESTANVLSAAQGECHSLLHIHN